MHRRRFLEAIAGGLVATAGIRAQPAGKVPVVGFLTLAGAGSLALFQDAMREWLQPENVEVVY